MDNIDYNNNIMDNIEIRESIRILTDSESRPLKLQIPNKNVFFLLFSIRRSDSNFKSLFYVDFCVFKFKQFILFIFFSIKILKIQIFL